MCGITGYWKAEGLQPEADKHLRNMAETLYHRGPDGYGYHVDEENGLAMGHSRLSIIDLETGDQPLYGSDNQKVLTVNGEFYDYKRIRTNLRLEGFRFKTKSDSEIAIPLFEKYGLAFVEQLRGEYAFALFDGKNNQLILVRDRFGIKPLFYHISNGNIYWGSEIKSLFAHPDVPRAFNNQAVLHQLMHTMVPGTSAYKDIHALKPGHMLIIRRNNDGLDIQDRKYWDMDFPRENERDLSKPAAFHIKRVQEELLEAVALRLEADVPVGCY
ncbi:MAG: asparagine synthetase B, partial [Cytophagales bacterium]|nr:asparagine synthetase B [Cytophagales bacterium]